ncbi:glycosyltransferase family 2 protein [Candidatus Roizmanbacteria bacterium]|nr:glycosyltransferase family 2 protein [Candidatus Roizmanbacteria bacterium]
MKLSLCIATFNEEKFIHYPLDSAYDLVDEVIIVDGGSEDKTLEIARSYGEKIKIIQTDNPPMFHKNKQKALDVAKGEWILQLDADEALSDALKAEIQRVILADEARPGSQVGMTINLKKQPVAYWFPRLNYFLGRYLRKGGIYPDYTIRLYKNGVAHFPCKSVHENVVINGEVGYTKADLLHFADPNFERYLTRWNRYTSMDAMLALEKKEQLNAFSYFVWKPTAWFFTTYFRHRGYVDGFPGFVFALFSSIRFWVIYIKVWQEHHKKN